MHISRRKLLFGILGGVVVAPVAYYAACPRICKDHILGYIPPELYDSKLGGYYIKVVLAGMSRAEIVYELKEKLPWYYVFFPRKAIHSAVLNDYANEDVVIIGGWVLPRVIVLLCAAAHTEVKNVS
ncbi:MAG: hypothetical protein ACN2B6_06025 [Rickettsiales bacterium]